MIEHFAASRDCHSTLACLQSLGVEVQEARRNRNDPGARAARAESARPVFWMRAIPARPSGFSPAFWPDIRSSPRLQEMNPSPAGPWEESFGRSGEMGAAIESRERELPPLRSGEDP